MLILSHLDAEDKPQDCPVNEEEEKDERVEQEDRPPTPARGHPFWGSELDILPPFLVPVPASHAAS